MSPARWMNRCTAIAALVVATHCAAPLFAQGERNVLAASLKGARVQSVLLPAKDWKPYGLDMPGCFTAVSAAVKADVVRQAERQLGTPWEQIPALLYMDYSVTGNRDRYQDVYFGRRKRLATLVMAEVLENKRRFMPDIVNGVWAVCEETSWCLPAHNEKGLNLPDAANHRLDLFAAETASLLAWTQYLLGPKLDSVSVLLRKRIAREVTSRTIDPYMTVDWDWSGLSGRKNVNNWNPWINSNMIASVLLLEADPVRRAAFVERSIRSVDIFINVYPDDGGCDEGPAYWNRAAGALFDYLEMLHSATGGRVDIYSEPLIGNMARFIYRTWIAGDYVMNFSDAGAKSVPDAAQVFRFGRRIGDPRMTGFAAFLARSKKAGAFEPPPFGSLSRPVADLMVTGALDAEQPAAPYAADVWMQESQIAAARSDSMSDRGLYFAALGAHNAQSHNHNDVGSFVVYANGAPMLIDVGVGQYTAQTFGARRYDIWTMQSQYHNLPTINGVQQKDGRSFEARDVRFTANARRAVFSLDIAGAYPPEANVTTWRRTIALERNKHIDITDAYELSHAAGVTTLNLMTAGEPAAVRPGEIELRNGQEHLTLSYDAAMLEPTIEPIAIDDTRLNPVWGKHVYRIVFTMTKPSATNTIRLSLKH